MTTDADADGEFPARAEFLAGDRPDDVALFLADSYVSDDRLTEFGERVAGGTLIVVDGERGRSAFQAATGTGAMQFAKSAMDHEGIVNADLAGGTCPETPGDDADHEVQFVFAFTEEQNEDVGGIYAEGDVVHAYAQCSCGVAYSDRWNPSDADADIDTGLADGE
ncbi:DUF5807 family protein [Halobiforma nitratireducens]|uniref:Uncharacterized protein n=1 Tax=Halobiforma nitratireducens JCM 10879 TaxID=1227454 RepID=M0LJ06_9EURY|nr:DUF5807 family protein [Halobiforma nitratireducens]EMA32419.1 hypothetical protein C446_14954 [Halobiforma nitratireducens JCM 10879]